MTDITKNELIQFLNSDIGKEWAAAIQYIQHAAMLTGPEYQAIQKELLVHANEEIGHSVSIADLIATLGGAVTLEVAPRHTDASSKKMLEQDLAGEQDAIARYKIRIAQAQSLSEYGVAKILTDILSIEEEHERDLKAALGK
jgi:bacterioferritin